MAKRKAWEDWEVVGPRFTKYGNRVGEPVCQSRNQSGYWKGSPCGNAAKFTVGTEVCCQLHIAQALDRNPGVEPKPLEWTPEVAG